MAEYLTGESDGKKRTSVKNKLASGLLSVACLCGVWNEGESIHILRTVIFGDLRHSNINIRQVSQRGSRKHMSKPFYNIVLPIEKEMIASESDGDTESIESEEGEDESNYLKKILKIFSDEDLVIKQSIQKQSYTRFSIRMNNEIIKET